MMPQDDDFISYEELQEETGGAPSQGGGGLSTLTIVLIGILIVTVGGLSSYYYYTFQSQGQNYSEQITRSWDNVINASVGLNDQLRNVESPSDLNAEEDTVRDTNTTIREVLFNLPSSPPPGRSGLHQDLNTFLNNYLEYIDELQAISVRGEDIESVEELNQLENELDNLRNSYTQLKSNAGDQLTADLPDDFFDFASDYEEAVATYLENQAESEQEINNAVSDRVTQFMQAVIDGDLESARSFVDEDQQNALPALIQGSVEIQGFSIGEVSVGDEQEQVEVRGTEEIETPDEETSERIRIFILERIEGDWMITDWSTEENDGEDDTE